MGKSFADILNQEKKKAESNSGGGDFGKVGYPQTKHNRMFIGKDNPEILVQILPSSDLVSVFAEPVRKVFLKVVTSNGKEIKQNFTMTPDEDHGSLLEAKLKEWADKGLIPNGFGGQTKPSRKFLVNAVNVIPGAQQGTWVQEVDEYGQPVVRLLELPQSAYSKLITALQDPLNNTSGSELSFLDVNKPAPVKISKPPQGSMEYGFQLYSNVMLPPLPQGWENHLEDLSAHAVPTERLENGAQWVQAFVDMKEGRKPSGNSSEGSPQAAPQQPQTNPYAQQQAPQAPQQPTTPPSSNDVIGSLPDQSQVQPQQPQAQQQQAPQQPSVPQAPQQPNMSAPQQPSAPQAPQAPQQPATPNQQAPQAPNVANTPQNGNGLPDIDAMLDQELNS